MAIAGYKDLAIWQRSMNLVVTVYALTRLFPKEELYTLSNQIRRAVISIPSNIAEGHSKKSTRDFMRFLNIAYGSRAELETQIIIAEKLGYIDGVSAEPILKESEEIGRMINGLLSSLEKKLPASRSDS